MLRDGGRVASVAIEPAPDLDSAALDRARALGPSSMTTDASLLRSTERAGLVPVSVVDWTAELGDLLRATLEELARREGALRAEEGDEVFEHEREKKRSLLQGVDESLLVRTLVVARR